MGRVLVRCLLAVGVLAVCAFALARVPAQFEVVQRYATLLSEGGKWALRSMFASDMVFAELDLFWREERGTEAQRRVWALVDAGVRLEVSFESASADGALIVTRERMWRDDIPESLVPLRSTVVYLVDGDRLLSVTRVLDADQHDALMRETIVGDWRFAEWVFDYLADGTYDIVQFNRPYDSGDYTIEAGVLRVVSGEQTEACQPGDVGLWRLFFTNPDRHTTEKIEDMCTVGRAGPTLHLWRITE